MSYQLANDNYWNESINYESRHLNNYSYTTELCQFHSSQNKASKVPDRNKNLSTNDEAIHLHPYQSFTIYHSQDVKNYDDSFEFSSANGCNLFEGENWREQNHNHNIRQNTTNSYGSYHMSHDDEHSFFRNESCFGSDFQIRQNQMSFFADRTNEIPYNFVECESTKSINLENEEYNYINYPSKNISNTYPNYRTKFGSINPDTENNSKVHINQDHAIETNLQFSSQKPAVHQGSRNFTFMGGNSNQMVTYMKFTNLVFFSDPYKS